MIGIISDIHGNWDALWAVLSDGASRSIREWICLGDIVGYGADPDKCVDIIRERCKIVVLGNHDEAAAQETSPDDFNPVARQAILWTRYALSESNKQWLKDLPLMQQDADRLYVHASPRSPEAWNYIFTESEARRQLEGLDLSIRSCFVGHTHESYRYKNANDVEMINVGSVGQPRDGDPRASYAILDETTGQLDFSRIDYDIEAARQKIIRAKLPRFLADRLLNGQ